MRLVKSNESERGCKTKPTNISLFYFIYSSLVFISHLTNFLSMYVDCFFLSHFAFEKQPARFET